MAGVLLYPALPNQIASHWNAAGEANGFQSKFWGVFLVPAMMIVFFFLRLITLRIDPLKQNIESFKKYYDGFWIGINVFFLYIYGLTLAWNLGYRFNFTGMIIPAMSVLFYGIGIMMEQSKRNWFMGIRTPWTLSSDIVWSKTHKLGGVLFKIAACLSLFGMMFQGDIAILCVLVIPILLASVTTVIYSYIEYRKQQK